MIKKIFLVLMYLGFMVCTHGQLVKIQVSDRVMNHSYLGNGAEWDPYDEMYKMGASINDINWKRLFQRMDFMRMGYVRCMINSAYHYYDDEGHYDKTRYLEPLKKLLGYCQSHHIDVIYGEFNPPKWSMKESQEWVDMSVDYLNYLVNDLGFSCIKNFIIFNEPDGNWASTNGDYDVWLKMLRRFHHKMQSYPGLSKKVSFAAPDVVVKYRNPASKYDTDGWLSQSAKDADSIIGVYDIHAYPGQALVRNGGFIPYLKSARQSVPAGKKLLLGEAGYKYDGDPADSLLWKEYKRRIVNHPFTKGSDCNMLCYDYFYGLDMPLLSMNVMKCGLSGMAVWMLDDAMHSNGDSAKNTDMKIWGMWNSLGEKVFNKPEEENIRPWYYTWSLMCRYFPKGCDILDSQYKEGAEFNAVTARKDGRYTIAIVNYSKKDMQFNLSMPKIMDKVMMYRYSEETRLANSNGIPLPCKKNLSFKNMEIDVPANSFVLLTNMK